MALTFADGFDAYAISQILAKWTNLSGSVTLGGPGRLGYGQYVNIGTGASLTVALTASQTTIITGFAFYANTSALGNQSIFSFQDNAAGLIGYITQSASGQIGYSNSANTVVAISSPGLLSVNAWCYIEVQVTFSASTSGSVTIRFNGQTVATAASVNTSGTNVNPCVLLGPTAANLGGNSTLIDDFYVLNSTAPNNAFLGDVKILPLYPIGNGRISGFGRFGGTSSGNYTAVGENPPDGDSSYVYTATPGTTDAYTITTLSNVTTVKAVQVNAYARKDDTPSRVLGLGVGNGTTENFDAGHSLNTSYTYVRRPMDINPLTSAAWSPSDFTTLQLAQQLIS